MSKIWPLPHVGTLTGTMRIPIDKENGGTSNDTAHFTPDDIVEYVEDNADLGGGTASDATPAALGTAAPGVATAYSRGDHVHQAPTPAGIGAATVAEAGAALTAAQNAQTTAEQWAHPPIVATIDDTDSPFTVLPQHAGGIIRVDTSNGVVELNMPPSLATTRPFRVAIELIDDSNGAEITSDGSLVFYPTGTTEAGVAFLGTTYITMVDTTRASVSVDLDALAEAQTAFSVATAAQATANAALPKPGGTTTAGGIVTGSGTTGAAVAVSTTTIADLTGATSTAQAAADAAQTTAADALYPLVQTAHTSATKTLAAGDAGDIIPLDAASNAIEVTIPHTLFAAAGAGRAWVGVAKVVSVAGGAVTFVGSGGIVVSYSGKNPGTTPYAAGDYLTVVVDSAATGYVFCASVIP